MPSWLAVTEGVTYDKARSYETCASVRIGRVTEGSGLPLCLQVSFAALGAVASRARGYTQGVRCRGISAAPSLSCARAALSRVAPG